jgi:FtsH-binding integral membrane protein
MTLKQKALLQTLTIIVGTTLGSVAISYLVSVLDRDTLVYIFGTALFGFVVYSIYGLVLSRLET